jgi:hypothetical protein
MSETQRAKLSAVVHTPEWVAKALANNPSTGRKWKRATSRYKGVCWAKEKGVWMVNLYMGNGRGRMFGGYYPDEITAAHAWDLLVRENRPELRLNFPEVQPQSKGSDGIGRKENR